MYRFLLFVFSKHLFFFFFFKSDFVVGVEISRIILLFTASCHIIFFFSCICPSGIEIALNKDARQKSRLKITNKFFY